MCLVGKCTPLHMSCGRHGTLQNTLMEWSNITGFLCAAGGVAVHHGEVMTRSNLRVSFSPTPSSTPAQQDFLSARK